MLASMFINEVIIVMVLIVREIINVSPDDLPRLPPNREIEFEIYILLGIASISKAPYQMAPMSYKI